MAAVLPPEPFRFAGTWNVATTYIYGDMVVGSDLKAYVNGVGPNTGSNPVTQPSAVWAVAPESGGGVAGVSKILAGTNISIDPVDGLGDVTVNGAVVIPSSISQAGASVSCEDDGKIIALSPTLIDLQTTGAAEIALSPATGRININALGTGTVALNLGNSTGLSGQLVGATGDGLLIWQTPPEPNPTGITTDLTLETWTVVTMGAVYSYDYDIGIDMTATTNFQGTTINSNPTTASACWLISATPIASTTTVRLFCAGDPALFNATGPLYIAWHITVA